VESTVNPVARTAYYCCGVRAHDAALAQPVCGDGLAQRFMSPDALEYFSRLAKFKGPLASNAARHRMIDDLLQARIQPDPKHLVVLLGAGFDTRAFRLGGGRWVEVDQASVMGAKNRVLPADGAANPLERLTIDFAKDSLGSVLGHLDPPSGVTVVMEGVTFYLTQSQLRTTLAALRTLFPGHRLICDLQSRFFAATAGAPIRSELRRMGTHYGELVPQPWNAIAREGYRLLSRQSIVAFAAARGGLWAPAWLLNSCGRFIRDGYTICEFEAGPASNLAA